VIAVMSGKRQFEYTNEAVAKALMLAHTAINVLSWART
jgi:hypothetical protein